MSTDPHHQGGADKASPWDGAGDEAGPPPDRAGARRRPPPGRSGRSAPPRRRRKARRVHRVVHHLDVWSVAKVGSIFVASAYVVGLLSGYLLWRAADRVGTIDGIEGFMEDTGGYDTFVLRGDVVFSSAVLIGAVAAVLAVCLIVLTAILFNLISDVTGGIRMTVIDEDLIVTPARRASSGRPDPPTGTSPAPPPGLTDGDRAGDERSPADPDRPTGVAAATPTSLSSAAEFDLGTGSSRA